MVAGRVNNDSFDDIVINGYIKMFVFYGVSEVVSKNGTFFSMFQIPFLAHN